MMVMQELRCPVCRVSWDIDKDFVKLDDAIPCKNGCGAFTANADTVVCTLEDRDGLLQTPLRDFGG